MFNRCHFIGVSLLGFFLALGCSRSTSAAEAEVGLAAHSDAYTTLYELKEGDTPENVAEMFLGDSKHAQELLRFNQLERKDFMARKLPVIAIPGKTRTEAIDALDASAQARDAAQAAQAMEYAREVFAEGTALFALAEQSREAAAYDKARHLADQAGNKFKEALARANEQAPVQQQGGIKAVSGDVRRSSDGGITWETLSPDSRIRQGDMVQTGPLSRVLIRLDDGSVLKLLDDSRLEFKNLRMDPRSEDRTFSLDLWTGMLEAKLAPLKSTRASFKIDLAGTSIAVNGAHLKLGRPGKNKGWIALYKGQALVTAKDKELFLPVRKGILITSGKLAGEPVSLLEPPFVTDPEIPTHRTAGQQPLFAWRETGTRKLGAYRLEIARDADLVHVVKNDVLKGDNFKPELLEEGTYFWRVSTIDRNGIEGLDVEPAQLNIQKNLDIVIMQKQPALEIGGRQVVSAKHLFFAQPAQTDTSVVAFDYQINQQERQPLPRFFRLGGEGQMVVRVWGMGAGGEQGPQQQIHVYVDRTPPAVTCLVDSRPETSLEKNEKAVVMLKARDPAGISLLEYSINNESFQPYLDPIELEVNSEMLLRYRATDGVGNVSRSKSLRIYPSSGE